MGAELLHVLVRSLQSWVVTAVDKNGTRQRPCTADSRRTFSERLERLRVVSVRTGGPEALWPEQTGRPCLHVMPEYCGWGVWLEN